MGNQNSKKIESVVLAIQTDNDQRVIELLQTSNNFDQTINQFGDTALHYAAHLGKISLIKQLVKKGADVHVTNEAGYTPLDVASHNKQVDCVTYLIGCCALKTPFFNKDYDK